MTITGRAVLFLSGLAVVLGPLAIAAQLSRLSPAEWLALIPLAIAAAISWLVLAP